jgi:hypothetical protein
METGERFEGTAGGSGDAVTDAAMKAIREAEAEEIRQKKAAQKAAFNAQVRGGVGCLEGLLLSSCHPNISIF